jgi:hypothetical protein
MLSFCITQPWHPNCMLGAATNAGSAVLRRCQVTSSGRVACGDCALDLFAPHLRG